MVLEFYRWLYNHSNIKKKCGRITNTRKILLYVIVPSYYRGSSSDPSNYLFGQLLDQVSLNTSKQITGRSKISVVTLTVKVYNPSGTLIKTTSGHNTDSVAISQTFNAVGMREIVVTSPNLPNYTFTVRVV